MNSCAVSALFIVALIVTSVWCSYWFWMRMKRMEETCRALNEERCPITAIN